MLPEENNVAEAFGCGGCTLSQNVRCQASEATALPAVLDDKPPLLFDLVLPALLIANTNPNTMDPLKPFPARVFALGSNFKQISGIAPKEARPK